MKLNEQQARAAETLAGPVLITAGAGTGKTRVLTERFLNAVRGIDGSPRSVDEIIAITFTEKAAGELAERVRGALRAAGMVEAARAVDGAWISTIHGLCTRLLRQYAIDMGLDPEFGVADAVTAGRMREQAFEDAATGSLAEESGARLFGEYGFAAVYDATAAIADALRIGRLEAAALRLEPACSATRLLGDCVTALSDAKTELDACGDTAKCVAQHIKACDEALEHLRALPASELDEATLAEEVWRALDGYSGGRRSTKASRDALEPLFETIERLARDAAASAAAPMAAALLALVARFDERYEALKRGASLLDFDDLQLRLLDLFDEHGLEDTIRRRVRLLMVDEFQDTDRLQLEIVERFAPTELCTVGDERQSIYGFRGADVAVYVQHADDMCRRGAAPIELGVNYRSHADVLTFVNAVFGSDELFGNRLVRLEAGRDEPEPIVPPGEPRVEVVVAHREGTADSVGRATLAATLAERFAALRDDHEVRAHDMVVLVRAYTHAAEYAEALRMRGFSVTVVGGSRFLGLPETAMLTALCRVLANPMDNEALGTVLLSDLACLSDDALWRIGRAAESMPGRPLWLAARGECSALRGAEAARLQLVTAAIERARSDVGRLPLSTLLLRCIEDCDLDVRLLGEGEGGRDAYANILKFVRLADDFERQGGAGPAGFVAHLAAQEEFGEQQTPATLADDESPAVRIMSVHAAKGLEFPVVAVPELNFGGKGDSAVCRFERDDDALRIALKLPSQWRSGSTLGEACKLDRTPLFEALRERAEFAERDEAQRLFYVAATRAKELLLLGGWRNVTKAADGCGLFDQLNRRLGIAETQDEGARTVQLADGQGRSVDVRVSVVMPGAAEEVTAPTPPADESTEGVTPETVGEGEHFLPRPPGTRGVARPRSPEAPARLSYSGIAAYELCAFRYFARSVLRVGELRSTSSAALGFGSAVHAALQLAADGAPPRDRISAIGAYHRLDAVAVTRLGELVEAYAASPLAAEVRGMASVRTEAPFAVRLESGAGAFLLDGSLDVYAVDGQRALIVDYKSGTSGSAEELIERYRLQAECYALAALRDGRTDVRVVFVRPQVRADDGSLQQIGYEFGPDDEGRIVARIEGVHVLMAAGQYPHLERWDDQLCSDCPTAFVLCPVRREQPTEEASTA